ncbi:unnamed protein product [Amoebophrya sp. A120]|nr:unnamed protein product [Amoebophrya sp. A120]|eukprot:GSA120T00004542001.1
MTLANDDNDFAASTKMNEKTPLSSSSCYPYNFSFPSPSEWDFRDGGVYFLRHAESLANVVDYAGGTNTIEDAGLSDAGREEAKEIGRYMRAKLLETVGAGDNADASSCTTAGSTSPDASKKTKIALRLIVSPLRRTLATAELVFGEAIKALEEKERLCSLEFAIDPDMREVHPRASNVGVCPKVILSSEASTSSPENKVTITLFDDVEEAQRKEAARVAAAGETEIARPAASGQHETLQDAAAENRESPFFQPIATTAMKNWRMLARDEKHMIDADRLKNSEARIRNYFSRSREIENNKHVDKTTTATEEVNTIISLTFCVTHWGYVNAFGNTFCKNWALLGSDPKLQELKAASYGELASTAVVVDEEEENENPEDVETTTTSSHKMQINLNSNSLFYRKTKTNKYSLLRKERYGDRIWRDFVSPDLSVKEPERQVFVRQFDIRNCSLTKLSLIEK